MRRWKRIEDGTFKKDTILVLVRDDHTCAPYMNTDSDGDEIPSETRYMVEIDEKGNTIRTYKVGDTLNEGTLVGGTMNKTEAMKRLDAIEAEAKALRELINKPDNIEYSDNKRYGLTFVGCSGTVYKCLLISIEGMGHIWHSITSPAQTFNGKKYSSGQSAIDDVSQEDSVTIHVFDESKEALEFLLDGL